LLGSHELLTQVFGDHVFVGAADERYCLLQHKTKLYLVDVPNVTEAFFYEQVVGQFGCARRICLSTPVPVEDLVRFSVCCLLPAVCSLLSAACCLLSAGFFSLRLSDLVGIDGSREGGMERGARN
jgi:hypothetical protein